MYKAFLFDYDGTIARTMHIHFRAWRKALLNYNINIKKDDPSFIVLDEICGMSISLFMIPKSYMLFFVSFLIFRFFDIFKPLYINESQKIKYGIGIMVDDVLSGLYTLAIMNLIMLCL